MRNFAFVLAVLLGACSEDFAVDGTWGRCCASGDHFGSYVMKIRRDGERITGLACRLSSGHRIFRDRPVEGRYPHMSFDSSLDNSSSPRILLTIVGEGSITGTDDNPQTNAAYSFSRVASSEYDACVGATP